MITTTINIFDFFHCLIMNKNIFLKNIFLSFESIYYKNYT